MGEESKDPAVDMYVGLTAAGVSPLKAAIQVKNEMGVPLDELYEALVAEGRML